MSQEDVAALLQAIPLPSVLIGQGDRILCSNGLALALLGDGINGRHFITAIRQPTVLDAVEGCLKDRVQRKTRYLTTDGNQDTTYIVTCSQVQTEIGDGVLVCFEDITHAEQLGQMRRDFVANVSHELRTPLTALLGFIETLRGPARNDAEVRDRFLDIMAKEAARMERLVRDLLSLSRVESEERVRPTEPVDLGGTLTSVQSLLSPLAEGRNVTLELTLPDNEIFAPGDPDQLRQVFTNLIENAVTYGGANQAVEISLSYSELESSVLGPAAVVSVRDHGPGLDPIHIPRLTERFYRADNHRSREMGGTGLGLAIVKHIVNRHRGRLRINSTLGNGSEFQVVLPVTPPKRAERAVF